MGLLVKKYGIAKRPRCSPRSRNQLYDEEIKGVNDIVWFQRNLFVLISYQLIAIGLTFLPTYSMYVKSCNEE